jgi:hypothetical protein
VDEDVRFQAMVDVLDTIRVASNTAKQKSLEQQDKFLGQDGGDVKVAVSLKKRPASATAPVSSGLPPDLKGPRSGPFFMPGADVRAPCRRSRRPP